jgi:endonuclease G
MTMIKKLLLLSTAAILFSACSKKTIDIPEKPYSITEDLESSAKSAYKIDTVQMLTGKWIFDNAVVGNIAGDLKNGNRSIRLKTGSLSMLYDIKGVRALYISHGKYGSDANSTWQVLFSTDGGTTYTQLGKNIEETNKTLVVDSFVLSSPQTVRFQIKKLGAANDAARVNLDDITFKGIGNPGVVVTDPNADPVEPTNPGTATTPRGITFGNDAQPTEGDNSNSLFGNPSQATMMTPDNLYLDQKYYTESYSSTRSIPNWVSWHIDAGTTNNTVKRQDDFAGFNGLPEGTYVVQSNSYVNSGFDRGHNCPSGDRTSSLNANSATFLMSNMIPQAPKNNQGTWEALESYLRGQVSAGNEVYVIMGNYGKGGAGNNGNVSTIDNGKITVPSNVWKVAVIIPNGNDDLSRVTNTTRVIAVNTPNNNAVDPDWKKYIVTVRDIEKATGYNLLNNLPQNIQDVIETRKDSGN